MRRLLLAADRKKNKMSIKNLYKNLNSDMESIAKRNKGDTYNVFTKKSFDSAGMENLEPVWEDANDISLESFNKTLYESVNSESAVVRNGITPLRDYDAVRGLREAFGKPDREEEPTIGTHPDFKNLETNNITQFGYVVTMFMLSLIHI